jgi:type I restriction enzyme S subunit
MALKQGYKQTDVGVIPEEWEADGLARYWSVTDCKHVTAQFVPQGFPIASIREVQSRFVDLTNAKQTTAHFYNLLIEGGRQPRPGDLILSRNATVGEVAQVAEWHPPFAMGQDVCLLRKKSSDYSSEFLQAVFQSPVILNQLADLMVGSTFKRANVQQIRNFAVPMPPPPEQRTIATALSDVDALLGGLDRLIAKKRDLKRAAMQQLLSGKTRLPGFQGGWEEHSLGNLASLYQPTTISATQFTESGFPVYGANGVVGCYGAYNHETWQTTVTCRGSTCGTVSRTVDRSWITGNAMVLNCDQNGHLSKEFFYHLLCGQDLSGCITGTGQPQIVRAPLAAFLVPLPPTVEEQAAIAAVLSDMDAEVAALEARRDKTRDLKQAMMQELLTGKTRLVPSGAASV